MHPKFTFPIKEVTLEICVFVNINTWDFNVLYPYVYVDTSGKVKYVLDINPRLPVTCFKTKFIVRISCKCTCVSRFLGKEFS